MARLIKEFRRFCAAPLVLFSLFLAACAPVGYGDVGFTYVNWPIQDQQLPVGGLIEVETHLIRLRYLSGSPDGAITPATRAAVKHFQSDIGAPPNGFVSPTLLTALRLNAGLDEAVIVAAPLAVSGVVPPPPSADDGDGRGGGNGGGGWN